MIFVFIILALLLILAGICYAIYRFAFYSPKKGQNDERRLMNSGQMQEYREEILARIDSLRDIAYEPVRIQSYDGLSLRLLPQGRRSAACYLLPRIPGHAVPGILRRRQALSG